MSQHIQTVYIGDTLDAVEGGDISVKEASQDMIKVLEGISSNTYEAIEERKQEIIDSFNGLSDDLEIEMTDEVELYQRFMSVMEEVYDWGDSPIGGTLCICLFDWGWERRR